MSMINSYYDCDRQAFTTTTGTNTTTGYTVYDQRYYYNNNPYSGMIESQSILSEPKPKPKTFQVELQDEVDEWLKVFN